MFNQFDPYNPYNPNPYNQNQYNSGLRVLFGCAGMILGALLVGASLIWFFILRSQNLQFIPDLQSDNLNIETFKPGLTMLGVIAMGMVGIYLAIGRGGRRVVGKLLSVLFTIALVIGIVFALFYAIFINPNIDMTRTGFARNSVTIDVGDTVHFKNPTDGITQVLCIGLDQKCKTAEEGTPAGLAEGTLTISPGQTVDVTFHETGYYTITSKNTSHMNITIHVTESSD